MSLNNWTNIAWVNISILLLCSLRIRMSWNELHRASAVQHLDMAALLLVSVDLQLLFLFHGWIMLADTISTTMKMIRKPIFLWKLSHGSLANEQHLASVVQSSLMKSLTLKSLNKNDILHPIENSWPRCETVQEETLSASVEQTDRRLSQSHIRVDADVPAEHDFIPVASLIAAMFDYGIANAFRAYGLVGSDVESRLESSHNRATEVVRTPPRMINKSHLICQCRIGRVYFLNKRVREWKVISSGVATCWHAS